MNARHRWRGARTVPRLDLLRAVPAFRLVPSFRATIMVMDPHPPTPPRHGVRPPSEPDATRRIVYTAQRDRLSVYTPETGVGLKVSVAGWSVSLRLLLPIGDDPLRRCRPEDESTWVRRPALPGARLRRMRTHRPTLHAPPMDPERRYLIAFDHYLAALDRFIELHRDDDSTRKERDAAAAMLDVLRAAVDRAELALSM